MKGLPFKFLGFLSSAVLFYLIYATGAKIALLFAFIVFSPVFFALLYDLYLFQFNFKSTRHLTSMYWGLLKKML